MTLIMEYALYFFLGYVIYEAEPDKKSPKFWIYLVIASILVTANGYVIRFL